MHQWAVSLVSTGNNRRKQTIECKGQGPGDKMSQNNKIKFLLQVISY